jgi:lipopolysaccharide/colanic/teichoic acid biosynthesis glycosyltransferase
MASAGGGGLTQRQAVAKRGFDILAAALGLIATAPLLLLGWLVATLDTGQNGLYTQIRIGRYGLPFRIVKLRTMLEDPGYQTSVTTRSDPRITRCGQLLRNTKWNELPQLWNVLVGDMSFVGPRPEVPGFADQLVGDDTIILTIRPGITGPATLRFCDEEIILESVDDPDAYNVDKLYPEKVRLNRAYVESYSFAADIRYILLTLSAVTGSVFRRRHQPDLEPLGVALFEDHVGDRIGLEPEVARIAESA